ncbi:ADP-ribose diphosphatase [Halolactibacillus alkaliphilus]|uniref:ADP-ribose diphosphatase n=1 Tax=Halolactibacillus alkaliphilus TaxID=442899 RepID=A0A511X1B0_9BACI|nr:NUDIX hydrolase [Halolactibacillus alkaliphilus]GEN56729.1 ADP-ribose diphosphatase [Halolactibacillus alkaliphilus]GGN69929.1 ADP-ribose diphosphatase [Halolactibacillus alkaliphilus]SFO78252.1 ADP-ribose pyrophosphatase [Halolactibacillus alkaliphilus]
MSKFEEKTIKTKEIFNGKIIKVSVDDVRLPNGETSIRELVKHQGAVAVIAVTEDKRFIMVEQYRKPLEKALVEVPAGKLEPNEAPEVTAIRELEEETGFTTEHLEYVTSFYTTPGFCDELIYLYYTDKLIPLTEEKALDEDEFLECQSYTMAELDDLIKRERIHDLKTMYAVQYLKLRGFD